MLATIPYTYSAQVIPFKARNVRTEYFCGAQPAIVEVPECVDADAPLAFRVPVKKYGEEATILPIRFHDGRLWKPAMTYYSGKKAPLDLESFIGGAREACHMPDRWCFRDAPATPIVRRGYRQIDGGEGEVIENIRKYAESHLVIGGVFHVPTTEPRYWVYRDHGGWGANQRGRTAGIFIEKSYRSDDPGDLDYYFAANDFAGAIDLLARMRRAGFESDENEQPRIEVLFPEAVRLDPRADAKAKRAENASEEIAAIEIKLGSLRDEERRLVERREELLASIA